MAKHLNYEIGFKADTRELKSDIKSLVRELNEISKNRINLNLDDDLRSAARAAIELENHLKSAMNQDTGKLDLSKFRMSLEKGGKSLADYRAQLEAIGPAGRQAFLDLSMAIVKAETPLIRTSNLMNELWTTMKNTARWQLTSSALHSFMGGLSTAYGYSKDLNKSLNNIRIVAGQSNDEMAEFAENANKAAKRLSAQTTDYTDAALIYYQQGLSDEEVLKRADVTIKMANVARESTEIVSDQLTAVWNNFYDGSKSLEYYADVMTALGAATASSTDEISEGLNKFAAIASSVGLSYEYATAALATVTATTRQSADVVGTAYKTLFARIQGLTLGETLDDGTNLNKYSKALYNVGINIKDQNGQLKDMDILLDEMGNKWKYLNKDQQIALAQTVAGVRQYTQLVALMDNWEFFQENLTTAYGAEGALQQQANVYAEGWEAARDRVRAAAEGVYDSLINPDFYIKMDNSIGSFLEILEDVIDTLGGFEGVANVAFFAFSKLFGNQMAQGLRNTVDNTRLLLGLEKQKDQVMRNESVNQIQQLASEDQVMGAQIDYAKKRLAAENEVQRVRTSLNDKQYNQIQQELQISDLIHQQYIERLKGIEAITEELNLEKEKARVQSEFYEKIQNMPLNNGMTIKKYFRCIMERPIKR